MVLPHSKSSLVQLGTTLLSPKATMARGGAISDAATDQVVTASDVGRDLSLETRIGEIGRAVGLVGAKTTRADVAGRASSMIKPARRSA